MPAAARDDVPVHLNYPTALLRAGDDLLIADPGSQHVIRWRPRDEAAVIAAAGMRAVGLVTREGHPHAVLVDGRTLPI